MVVRNQCDSASVIHQRSLEHNLSIFQGMGELGHAFLKALGKSEPYAGVRYVEALINVSTGAIEEILMPNPTRIYERETVLPNRKVQMVPAVLSEKHPGARLAVFVVNASNGSEIHDVIARDEIVPEARATLRESVLSTRPAGRTQKRAA